MDCDITRGILRPYFQPIICVDKNDVFAYEVLGRKCTKCGVESMGEFFHSPLVTAQEKVKVDRIIRFQALELLKKKNRGETLFINIQPHWMLPFLHAKESFPTLQEILRRNLDGSQVVIEICEDGFDEHNDILLNLTKRYREAGCKIAIDDFGEGFSSLARIALLKPDYVKISAGMLICNSDKEYGRFILQSIGILCSNTGTSLILEEVETMEQFLMGLDAGVRYFQGYFFAPPHPDFLDPGFAYEIIKKGLHGYIENKTSQQIDIMRFSDRMDWFIRCQLDIFAAKVHAENIGDFIHKLTVRAPQSWLRMYVCNYWGYQITPNYTRKNETEWLPEPQYHGRNWCWRPYFLPRVVGARHTGKGNLSQPYMDLETKAIVWTFVFPLSEDLFLLIDCRYSGYDIAVNWEDDQSKKQNADCTASFGEPSA